MPIYNIIYPIHYPLELFTLYNNCVRVIAYGEWRYKMSLLCTRKKNIIIMEWNEPTVRKKKKE